MLEKQPTVTLDSTCLHPFLDNALDKLSFTPFLGAGASSLRPSLIKDEAGLKKQGEHWVSLVNSMRDVFTQLEEEPERRYLLSVALTHAHLSAEFAQRSFAPSRRKREKQAPTGDWDLLDFQVHLVRFAAAYTVAFADGLKDSPQCIDGTARFRVRGRGKDDRLACLLRGAIDALRRVPSLGPLRHVWRPQVPGRGTPPYDVGAVLLMLESLARSPDVRAGETPLLGTDVMEWVADLIWFGFNYWVPGFPTSAELAFALSLACGESPLRRPDLAQAAERTIGDRALKYIQSRFRYCHEIQRSSGQVPRLHKSIALALKYQYLKVKERKLADRRCLRTLPDGHAGSGSAPGGPGRIMWPVVFTTNFDNLIEEALAGIGTGYDVLFPVQTRTVLSDDAAARRSVTGGVRWLCWRQPGGGANGFFRRWPQDQTMEGMLQQDDLPPGPLVIKLHGSPLYSLPEPLQIREARLGLPPQADIEHCLVLAESDYLYFVFKSGVMPPWLRDLLKAKAGDESNLWFLGYSISDWNIRLKLFEHLYGAMEGDASGSRHRDRIACSRPIDEFSKAILGTLGIKLIQGELDDVASHLERNAVRLLPSVEERL